MKFRLVLISILFATLFLSSCKKSNSGEPTPDDTSSSVNSNWVKVFNRETLDIYFADSLNGLALCKDGVYQSKNGGFTWKILVNNPSSTSVPFNVSMGSPSSFCYTTGDTICYSNDGGSTIKKFIGDNFVDCFFIDENDVIINGKKNIWLLKDRGASLVPQFKNDSVYNPEAIIAYKTIAKLNASRFWVARPSGNLYETKDKGLTWSKLNLNYNKLTTIQMLSDNLGFYADQSGVKRTMNGGISWEYLNFKSADLHFFDKNTGYVSIDQALQTFNRSSGVHYTKDGGVNWTEIFKGVRVIEIFFINENHAWFSTSNGIYKFIGP
jgi:photosystem II stability/assembly factor-like uncharacterized protein